MKKGKGYQLVVQLRSAGCFQTSGFLLKKAVIKQGVSTFSKFLLKMNRSLQSCDFHDVIRSLHSARLRKGSHLLVKSIVSPLLVTKLAHLMVLRA